MCECIKKLREETNLHVCGSFGLLDKEAFGKLKEAGLTRVHNNLETSRRYFPDVCTTHTFDDKIAAITAAKEAGLEVCSGGIMGIGETMEDRIDMALEVPQTGGAFDSGQHAQCDPGNPIRKRTTSDNGRDAPDRGGLPFSSPGCLYSSCRRKRPDGRQRPVDVWNPVPMRRFPVICSRHRESR